MIARAARAGCSRTECRRDRSGIRPGQTGGGVRLQSRGGWANRWLHLPGMPRTADHLHGLRLRARPRTARSWGGRERSRAMEHRSSDHRASPKETRDHQLATAPRADRQPVDRHALRVALGRRVRRLSRHVARVLVPGSGQPSRRGRRLDCAARLSSPPSWSAPIPVIRCQFKSAPRTAAVRLPADPRPARLPSCRRSASLPRASSPTFGPATAGAAKAIAYAHGAGDEWGAAPR
jgi:hypothetical protein